MDDGIATARAQINRGRVSPELKPAAVRSTAWRRYVLAVIAGLLLARGTGLWWNGSRPASVHYMTAPVSRGAVARAVTATGTINPELTIIVGTYVSGVIQELYCDYNTQVKRGQICAKIDPRPYQTMVDQAKANLAVAQGAAGEGQGQPRPTPKSTTNECAAGRRSSAVSKDTLDNAKSVYHQAQAQISFERRRFSSAKPNSMPRRSISDTPISFRRSTAP